MFYCWNGSTSIQYTAQQSRMFPLVYSGSVGLGCIRVGWAWVLSWVGSCKYPPSRVPHERYGIFPFYIDTGTNTLALARERPKALIYTRIWVVFERTRSEVHLLTRGFLEVPRLPRLSRSCRGRRRPRSLRVEVASTNITFLHFFRFRNVKCEAVCIKTLIHVSNTMAVTVV